MLVLETEPRVTRVCIPLHTAVHCATFWEDLTQFQEKFYLRPQIEASTLTVTCGESAAQELHSIVAWHLQAVSGAHCSANPELRTEHSSGPWHAQKLDGIVVTVDDQHGHAFIRCAAEQTDFFAHHTKARGFRVGDHVSFNLLSRRGRWPLASLGP